MLSEQHKKTHLQLNKIRPFNDRHISDIIPSAPHKRLTTIGELRRNHRQSKQSKRYASRPLIDITGNIIDYMAHCRVLADMCNRLAVVYHVENRIDTMALYRLFEAHNWTCPASCVQQSDNTPLNLSFCFPLHLGGKLAISNVTPRYYENLLAGEWHIVRKEPTRPTYRHPIFDNLAVLGGAA